VSSRPQLSGLTIDDAPERWHALGFAVGDGGVIAVDHVVIVATSTRCTDGWHPI
jgi:hypothetical protein